MRYLNAMNWRYAAKKLDPSKRIPNAIVERILEAARLAPPSSGLQPFSVVLVTNPDVKQRLTAAPFGQQQVAEASHVLVFAAWDP